MNGDPIEIYKTASTRVPAYQKFLKEHMGHIPEVKTPEDFKSLPFINKKNYLLKYPIEELCLDGTIMGKNVFLRSSGTSGKAAYWPTLADDERKVPENMEKFIGNILPQELRPALILIAFDLGSATAQTAAWAFRCFSYLTTGITIITPGDKLDELLDIFEKICPLYKQTLLMIYPPFAKILIEEGLSRGLPINSYNLKFITVGEGISESYRDCLRELMGYEKKNITSIWSAYGSTDFGDIGSETPLSISIRRILYENKLTKKILNTEDMPMIFQGPPSSSYFELVDGELVISRIQGAPLVRYRTCDRVEFIEYDDMIKRIKDEGYDPLNYLGKEIEGKPEFSFILLYGRMDGTIFFYGAYITMENIRNVLESPPFNPYYNYNGKFMARTVSDDKGEPVMEVILEDSPELRKADLNELSREFAKELSKLNSDYIHQLSIMGDKVLPKIILAPKEKFSGGWKFRHSVLENGK